MSKSKIAEKHLEHHEVSDREILGAILSAIQVLGEKLTGQPFVIALKTKRGKIVRLGTKRTRAYFGKADSDPKIIDGPIKPKSRGMLKRPRR